MDITNCKIWQQAAGDRDRNYAGLCLKWDIILNGPGYAGTYPDCKKKLEQDNCSARKLTDLRRFCEKIRNGDIIVLRLGTYEVFGVGEVVGSYHWLEFFGDVDGWDLQHTRRVRWLWKFHNQPKKFQTYTMKSGDTTQILNSKKVLEWLSTLEISNESYSRALVELPAASEACDVPFEHVSEFLFDKGVASASIENLLKEIGEFVRIAKWYKKVGNPSESETVAYLVVPLLRALGWTPQKMAIEWKRVDVALFKNLPREDENLTIVVEAKKMGNSCLSAVSQAESYAKTRSGCRRLIVTDGIRFGVYTRKKDEFVLHAYMNLTNLKEYYPIYDCHGTKMALLAMTPEWKET